MARWVERQRNILDFTFSSLLRRKGKNVALLLVYTLIVFVLASVMFLGGWLSPLQGLVEHVCFPCSKIVEDDGTVKLYYGGADTVQCVATGRLDDLIHACKHW